MKKKVWDLPQPQQPITIWQLYGTTVGECRSMPGFYCIVYQVSHKRSYQSTGSYIRVFTVLSTRCHTKGPTNLQVLIYGFLVYCLSGVTQKVLPI